MNYPDYSLVCTWGARSSTAQLIAQDLLHCARSLQSICPRLGAWHALGPNDKLTPLPEEVDAVRMQVLLPGNGGRRGVAADLTLPVGFSALLLTSKGSGAVSLMAHVGGGGDGAFNRVSLDLPRRGELAEVLSEPSMVMQLFQVLIRVWQPDWATVSHSAFADPDPACPVHWMLYGRDPLPKSITLPEAVATGLVEATGNEPCPMPGTLLVTTPSERFDYARPEHREVCERLKLVLRQGGWLPSHGEAH